jgi:hypothetical protein
MYPHNPPSGTITPTGVKERMAWRWLHYFLRGERCCCSMYPRCAETNAPRGERLFGLGATAPDHIQLRIA